MVYGSRSTAMRLAVCVLLTVGPSLASAGDPPIGQIWFSRFRPTGGTDGTTWVIDGNGQNETMVTTGEWPRLSPNGNHLLFHKDHANPGLADIYVRDLTVPSEMEIFSPGGTFAVHFDWSNDGAQVFFDSGFSIFRMDPDGMNVTPVIDSVNASDDAPDVNRVDGRLTFHNFTLGLFRANGDGTDRAAIPNTIVYDAWPEWSPDGQWIAFGHLAPNDFVEPEDYLVVESYYKIRPDGSGRTKLTCIEGGADIFGTGRAWTADGQYLVVPATIGAVHGLYAIATDGSGHVLRIATNSGSEAIDFVGSVTGAISGTPVAVPTCPPTPSPTATAPTVTPTPTATSTVTATATTTPPPPPTATGSPTPTATPTASVTPSAVSTTAIDHFLGYKAKEMDSEDKLAKDCTLALDDPIFDGAEYVTVSKVTALLLPADKNNEGIGDEITHLVAYKLKPAKQGIGAPTGAPGKEKFPKAAKHAKRAQVEVTNQFGNLFLDTLKEELLLVPTQKDLAAPPIPDLAGSAVDHYKCYKVKPAKVTSAQAPGGKFPKGLQATAADQFMDGLIRQCAGGAPKNAGKSCKNEKGCGGTDGGTSFCETIPHPVVGAARLYDLTKPVRLCAPVAKTAIDTIEVDGKGTARTTSCAAIAPAAIQRPETVLVCYQAKAASKVLDAGVASRLGTVTGATLDPKQGKHAKRTPFLLNQLPKPGRVQTTKEQELCVPSTVLDTGTLR